LIPVKATLIVVPPQLGKQWPSEIKKFTGMSTYNVVTVLSQAEMNKVTAKAIMAADIVIVASSLFNSDRYQQNLAAFAGSRSPPGSEGRRYNDWRKTALVDLAEQVDIIRTRGTNAARVRIDERRNRYEKEEAEELFVQKKRAVGSAYVAQEEAKEKAGEKRKRSNASDDDSDASGGSPSHSDSSLGDRAKKAKVVKVVDDPWKLKSTLVRGDWKAMHAPPLEMFLFNRVVVDEFTYYKGQILAGITGLKGRARWVLSGTPPLGDFADVKTISVFLGINLGIDDDMEGKLENKKKVRKEWSGKLSLTIIFDIYY
jgi:hypothetical protein